MYAVFGDDSCHALVGRDVEGRVGDGRVGRCPAPVAIAVNFLRGAFLDRDGVAIGRVEVNGGQRGGDVEGQPVGTGRHGMAIGADLIGDIAVGRYPIRSDDDCVDASAAHLVGGHAVGYQGEGNSPLGQFPGGEPSALQQRTRLADHDLDAVALVGGLQHAEGRTEAGGGGERAGVAVVEYALAGRKQVGPGFGQGAMPLFVVGGNLAGNFQESGSNGRERIRTLG